MSKPLGGEKCSPEQKLEYLKRYMTYWIEHRHWEKHNLMLHLRAFEAFGMVIFPKTEPLKTFDEWLIDTKRAEDHLTRIQNTYRWATHRGLDVYVPKKHMP
jgi:hypothetical protein